MMKSGWRLIGGILLIVLIWFLGSNFEIREIRDLFPFRSVNAQEEYKSYLPLVLRYYPAPVLRITSLVNNQTVTTTSNCIIKVSGTIQGSAPGWYIRISVFTNQWYLQNPVIRPPSSGAWAASPIYLAGQGGFNNHRIVAILYDNSNNAQIIDSEVVGIVRSNGCKTP